MFSMNWVTGVWCVVFPLFFLWPKSLFGFYPRAENYHRHWTRPRLYLKPVCMDCKRYQSSGSAQTNWIIWVQRARSKKSCLASSRDQNLKGWRRKRNQEDKPSQTINHISPMKVLITTCQVRWPQDARSSKKGFWLLFLIITWDL